VQGRERLYFEHYWNISRPQDRSLSEAIGKPTLRVRPPGTIRAGWAYFVSFPQAGRILPNSQTKLTMPSWRSRREGLEKSSGNR